MANPYPLPRETRSSDILQGDGRTVYGPFGFRIWDAADIVVLTARDGAELAPEAAYVSKDTAAPFAFFHVGFTNALDVGDRFQVVSRRLHERSSDVMRGGAISGEALERELSKQATVLQELRRDCSGVIARVDAHTVTLISHGVAITGLRRDVDRHSSEIVDLDQRLRADVPERLRLLAQMGTIRDQAAEQALAASGSARQAGLYAELIKASIYDFNFDSSPDTAGYDWNS
ncbi:hypothetical protein NS365_01095 [Aureimonas ureilytica]|uniref:Uncharacterized protein n=1 Tax=Aureimonas ureilytica TaxID=401562 RepID=A0A147DBL1_9HYPH|nr:hypothetical protein NS365_01095 [Aureimonas ureilytica]